jgi:hypothetical protein
LTFRCWKNRNLYLSGMAFRLLDRSSLKRPLQTFLRILVLLKVLILTYVTGNKVILIGVPIHKTAAYRNIFVIFAVS